MKEGSIQDADTSSEVDGHGSRTTASPEFLLHREGSNIYVAIEEKRDLKVWEEASSASNGDLLNAVNAFAAEYRTDTRGLLQEIEDLNASNKKQAQALQEVVKIYKYSYPHITGPATDNVIEENADRSEQRTKERCELNTAKTSRSNFGDRCTSEVDPDLLQQPHLQPLGKRSTLDRHQSASSRRRGSRDPHGENNQHMERSMNDEHDNRKTMPLDRTRDDGRREQRDSRRRASRPQILRAEHLIPWNRKEHKKNFAHIATVQTQRMMRPPPNRIETSLTSCAQNKYFLPENAAKGMVAEFRDKFVIQNSRRT